MDLTPENFFQVIQYLLEENSKFGSSLGGIMEFNLSGNIYTINFQTRKTYEGSSKKADCTQIMDRNDFLNLINKKVDPTELFMTQKLKLEGDIGMAMEFGNLMESLTEKKVQDILSSLKSSNTNQKLSFTSDLIMKKMITLSQKTDFGLTGIFQLCFTKDGKNSVWTIDSSKKPTIISQLKKPKPDCIITLDDKDFFALFQQKTNPMDLFMSQRLKIDGDMALGMQLQNLIDAIPVNESPKL